MKLKFPQVFEAAKGAEKAQWKIGDALLHEADDAAAGPRGLKAVSEELKANGIEYDSNSLGRMRRTAEAFPSDHRLDDVSFGAHQEAGNPGVLNIIVKAARKSGLKTVSQEYVEAAVQSIYREERKAREEAQAAAQQEQEEAEAEELAARKREMAANDKGEREKASHDRKRATERKREANKKAKAARTAPKRKERQAPAEEDVPALVLMTSLMANANQALVLARKTKELLGKYEIKSTTAAALTETALEAAQAWREAADLSRKAIPNKRGHLSVVGS